MDQQHLSGREMVILKGYEVLARLCDGVLETAQLHCEEIAVVWYTILAMRGAA